MPRKFDPFTQRWIDDSPEYPVWQRSDSNPVPPSDGTVNVAGRAERFVLDAPGRRYEPGAAAAEDRGHPKIRG